jgi:hypothetical protein
MLQRLFGLRFGHLESVRYSASLPLLIHARTTNSPSDRYSRVGYPAIDHLNFLLEFTRLNTWYVLATAQLHEPSSQRHNVTTSSRVNEAGTDTRDLSLPLHVQQAVSVANILLFFCFSVAHLSPFSSLSSRIAQARRAPLHIGATQ